MLLATSHQYKHSLRNPLPSHQSTLKAYPQPSAPAAAKINRSIFSNNQILHKKTMQKSQQEVNTAPRQKSLLLLVQCYPFALDLYALPHKHLWFSFPFHQHPLNKKQAGHILLQLESKPTAQFQSRHVLAGEHWMAELFGEEQLLHRQQKDKFT